MANPPDSNQSLSPDESPDIKQEVEGDGNQVIGEVSGGTVVNVSEGGVFNFVAPPQVNPLETSKRIAQNLPRSGVVEFVGRSQKLEELHAKLQESDRIAVTAVQGMGGIGKTELALQYAITTYNQEFYPGGVCWLRSRDQEIATQIISFAKTKLDLMIRDDLEAQEQVDFIWSKWREGNVLIVIDDVTDYEAIAPYLPPSDPHFKVLITTRQNFGASVTSVNIEELSDEDAIALLKSIAGEERIEFQLADAEALCGWVGNLPLGLELLGRFLKRKPDWAIAKLLERLESKRLAAKALVEGESGMTATLGVAAALELSWSELDEQEQDLACLLGMFAVAPIPWNLVEQCFEDVDSDDLEDWRDEGLRDRSLIKRVNIGMYQIHQVVQEFFREKLKGKGSNGEAIKSSFCGVMVEIAENIDSTPTNSQVEKVRGSIAHLEETATQWLEALADDNKSWPFVGIGRFYQGQGNYEFAELWYQRCLKSLRTWLGSDHPYLASGLNNLALLYADQGRYGEAEPLYLQALEFGEKLFGSGSDSVASYLHNLANLYERQGRYEEAEALYLQSLDLNKKSLGSNQPLVASNLYSLATLYNNQQSYEEAELLHLKALELRKKLFGNEHPDVARSLNNLALLYENQGCYEEAEALHLQALELRKKLFGNEHTEVAGSLNNLALLLDHQCRYKEAEALKLQALKLCETMLGPNHPDVVSSLNNLALTYYHQNRYEEAEALFLQALDRRKKLFGFNHPDIVSNLNNLAHLYDHQKRYKEAEPLYLQGLRLKKTFLGNAHISVAGSYFNMGMFYYKQEHYQKAKSFFLLALEIYNQSLNDNHPKTQALLSQLNDIPGNIEPLSLEDLGL